MLRPARLRRGTEGGGAAPFLPAIPPQAGVETPRNGLGGTRGTYPTGIPPVCASLASRSGRRNSPPAGRALGTAVAASLLLSRVSADRAVAGLCVNGARRERCCGKQGQNSLSR